MKHFISRLFARKSDRAKKAVQPGKPRHAPLIVSFDGRVVRLRLPEL